MIDTKLALAFYPGGVLRARRLPCATCLLSDTALEHLAQGVKGLAAWYKTRGINLPDWLHVLHQAMAGKIINHIQIELVARQVVWNQTLRSVGGFGSTPVVCTWASGHTSAFNPFFKEGEEEYWD